MRRDHLMLHEVVLPPSEEWAPEEESWIFFRVAQGVGYALRPGEARTVGKGEVVVSAPAPGLIVRASQLEEMQLHWFRLCPRSLSGFFSLYEEHYLESIATKTRPAARHFAASTPVGRQFAALVQDSPAGACLLARGWMLAVVVAVLAVEMAAYQFELPDRRDAGVRFKELIAAMPASELQNRTVAELARQCGCSERHFGRMFREHFGYSVRARQMEWRLQKAQQLLRDSDAKLIHVAMESGFRHLGLFHAVFRKRFGMSPTEWRQSHDSLRARKSVVRLEA